LSVSLEVYVFNLNITTSFYITGSSPLKVEIIKTSIVLPDRLESIIMDAHPNEISRVKRQTKRLKYLEIKISSH